MKQHITKKQWDEITFKQNRNMERPQFYTPAELHMIGIDCTLEEATRKIAELQAYIEKLERKVL